MAKLDKEKFEGVNRVVLSDEQIIEFGAGVSEKGLKFYVDKFGCSMWALRSVVTSLRKAGLELKLSSRRSPSKYKEIAAAINKLSS